jgi:RHS repeat-associated protein
MSTSTSNYQNTIATQAVKSAILLVALFIWGLDFAFAQEETLLPDSGSSADIDSVQVQLPSPGTDESSTVTEVESTTPETISQEGAEEPVVTDPVTLEGAEMTQSMMTQAPEPGMQMFSDTFIPEISGADGSLLYNYKMPVPPGRGAITPDLRLFFSNSNKSLSSIVAPGWSFNIPYIQRINKKGVNQSYSTDDFHSSLDGELVSQGSGVYKPRVENGSFRKYTYLNGVWKITDKDGTLYIFGDTTQARLNDPSNSSKVFTWMLESVTDLNSNTVNYTYYKDQGQIYPDKIKYNQENTFEVRFIRASKSIQRTSYAPGFKSTTAYKISSVDVYVSNTLSTKYNLTYSGESLQSVTVTGYESGQSVSLPPVMFTHSTDSVEGWETAVFNDPADPTERQAAQYTDVNGDGLSDYVYAEDSSRVTYINTGTSFTSSSTWTIPSDVEFYDANNTARSANVMLVDVNGDGLQDLVKFLNSDPKAYLNNGHGWNTSVFSNLPNPDDIRALQFHDVNGDGLLDYVYGENSSRFTYINTGTSFTSSSTWTIPSDTKFYNMSYPGHDPSVFLVDVNGDQLPDLLTARNSSDRSVYLNTGYGWSTTTFAVGVVPAHSALRAVQFIDVNGDSLRDYVYAEDGSRLTYLNTGSSFSYASTWNIPYPYMLYNEDYPGQKGTLQLAEIDGDGLPDIVSFYNGDVKTYLNKGTVKDDLIKITDVLGGQTTINYSTAQLSHTSNKLFFAPSVVSSIITNDLTNIGTTTYQYKGGYFYFGGTFDRRFAGYGEVIQTNPDGTKITSKYHQANGQSVNEPTDSYAKIGKMYEQTIVDSSNNIYLRKRTNYLDASIGANSTSSLKNSELFQSYDAVITHTDIANTFVYDSYGNITTETRYGIVSGSSDGTFTDSGTDKRVLESAYTTNTTDYLVGLPTRQVLKNNAGIAENLTSYFYDGDGNLLQEGKWIAGNTFATTTYLYNSYGLITRITDSLGNQTNLSYDSLNLYPATSTNALGHASGFVYDYSSGKVKISKQPNGKVIENIYDGLDRLILEKQTISNGSIDTMLSRSYYLDIANPYIKETIYRDTVNSQQIKKYLNGFGKMIQLKAQTDKGWATSDTVYDNMARIKKISLPYLTTNSSNSNPTTDTALLAVHTIDPLDRVINTHDIRGNTVTDYLALVKTVTDASGNGKRYTADAFGNLLKVEEFNGTSTYQTNYTYNASDLLIGLSDALGNIRSISYDGLGRRVELTDLRDASDGTYGVWNFAYNLQNLATTTKPDGSTITYTYDALNRILTEDANSTPGIDLVNVYDSCTNGLGLLCSVSSGAATTTYNYYKQGQINSQTVNIEGNSYAVSYVYDRQGKPLTITYPGTKVVAYTYNIEGLSDSVMFNNTLIATSSYGVHGKLERIQYANGLITENTYDTSDMYSLAQKVTGLSTTTLISVPTTTIVYSTTTIPGTTSTWFSDNMNGTFGQWTKEGDVDWRVAQQESEFNVPGSANSNLVAKAFDCDTDGIIRPTNSFNLSNASTTQIKLWRWIDNALDAGEYLKLELYNGSTWNTVTSWTDDDVWHYETINVPSSYFVSNFNFRLVAKMSDVAEEVEVDDVTLIVTTKNTYVVSTTTATTTATTSLQVVHDNMQNLSYVYDSVGNITSIVDESETVTKKSQIFTYDDLYRLTGVTTTNVASGTSAYSQYFLYNPIGNITNFNGTQYIYASSGYANPHAVTTIGTQAQTYDANGNLTNDSVWTHSWDYRNRLVQSSNGADVVAYAYNHNNERIKLVEAGESTFYPFADYEVVDGIPKIYVSFAGMSIANVEATTTTYLHTDHLGGTVLTTDSDGEIIQTLDYYPYGDIRLENGTDIEKIQFIGKKKDLLTSLNYLDSRYYNGIVGKFISQDPKFIDMTFDLSDPQKINSYSYARSNPINYIDRDGKEPVKVYVGTVSDFVSVLNNSPRQVGSFTGSDASGYMNSLGNVTYSYKTFFTPQPSEASYYNNKQGRYIYTENGGWIDMSHFMFYAGKAYSAKLNGSSDPMGDAVQAGYWQEFVDITTARHSAYSYEDLPSDWFGADFATNHFDPNSKATLSEQLQVYFTNVLKATDPKNASNYDKLPEKDSRNLPSSTNGSTKPRLYNKSK